MNKVYSLWPLIVCWSLAGLSLNFVFPYSTGRILFICFLLIGGIFNHIWVKYLDLLESNGKSTRFIDIFL